jgi:hypothetical protein
MKQYPHQSSGRPNFPRRKGQGCQMVCFQTKNPTLGKLWRALDWKLYILLPVRKFYGDLGYFMTIWYILYSFGTFFPVLVSYTKKNLATLDKRRKKTPQIAKHTHS